jgi:hypothetical protein
MKKKSVHEEIEDFLEVWDFQTLKSFLIEIIQIAHLYNVDENDDWVADMVGEENEKNVRLIRTVYLLSRIATFHAGKFANINVNYKNLWKKMEKHIEEIQIQKVYVEDLYE